MIAPPDLAPGPATTCHRSAGKPASSSSSGAQQRGEHGLGVGLGDHGVAGQQRREAVAQRHRERVVPRRDDPDDALGDAVDLDAGEAGDRRRAALGCRGARARCGRSSARSARRAAAPRRRACGPCRTPSTIRSMISSWRSSTRSCSRSSTAARSSSEVPPTRPEPGGPVERLGHVGLARLRDVASGWPVSGERHRDRLAGRGGHAPGQPARTAARRRRTRSGRARRRAGEGSGRSWGEVCDGSLPARMEV